MLQKLKEYIPIFQWLPNYKKSCLKGDLIAGLTVGVMLIPQGMAYAMLAGLPPIYGLYSSIIPLILYAIFGTSRQLAVGPVAMVSLLIATGVGGIVGANADNFIPTSILLSFLTGAILLSMGLFRLGFLVNFLSHPVVSGFTSAAALIIGISQLKHLLGIDIPRSHHLHDTLLYAFNHLTETNVYTFGIGVFAILLMLVIKRFKASIPGPLLAVVFGIGIIWVTGWHQNGLSIVGAVPQGLPHFSMPQLEWESVKALLPLALTIALIGFMESIAVAKAIQARQKNYELIPNQELIALGAANIGGSLFQSFPTTGGFSRTAVNEQSGAQTGLASIISAGMIILTLLFLTPLFYHLPHAILASVIMVAVFGLIDLKEARYLWKSDKGDFCMLLVTFLATLIIGIEGGILTGIILSLALIIYRSSNPHIAELGKIPNSNFYRNVDRFNNLEERDDLLIFRFDARLYFANADTFKNFLEEHIKKKGIALKAIILDAESINGIDSTGIHTIEELANAYQKNGLNFFISGIKGPIRDALQRTGLTDKIGENNMFFCIQDAVDYFDTRRTDTTLKEYVIQTNETKIY